MGVIVEFMRMFPGKKPAAEKERYRWMNLSGTRAWWNVRDFEACLKPGGSGMLRFLPPGGRMHRMERIR